MTHSSAWKRTPRFSGMWNCDTGMLALGRAAKTSWPVVFTPRLPTFARYECGPMPASATGQCWRCWKRVRKGLHYEAMNPHWEIAEFDHHPHDWSQARRCIVARRRIEENDPQPTLFTLERYAYRAWHTNLPLTPAGVWHFYDGRAGMEPRIRELREDFALRKIPTRAFAANALFLEVVRL